MRAFSCQTCGRRVHFENSVCLHCGTALGFRWDDRELVAASAAARCANTALAGCNWLVANDGELCASCALTRTRPSDDDPAGLEAFRVAEAAKRRLLFELGELGLPVEGLSFDLLSSNHEPVTTGHADGLVTLDLAEADDARREARRAELGEPYRTVLGHLRHEAGHACFPLLAPEGPALERARALLGDEREDYGAALERHYADGPPADWEQCHVSAYATMHPAEDWAETSAHVLHITDTLQTAAAYGVALDGAERVGEHPAVAGGFDAVLAAWLPLSTALNAMSRSMGRDDLYPFVLAPAVVEKLRLVHDLISSAGRSEDRVSHE